MTFGFATTIPPIAELEAVITYTRGQWSDGVGEHFDPCFKAALVTSMKKLAD